MLWFAKSLEESRASNARADLLSRAELPAPSIWSGSACLLNRERRFARPCALLVPRVQSLFELLQTANRLS